MFEPGCRGETKCSLRDICSSHVLEKSPNGWRGKEGEGEGGGGERRGSALSDSVFLACTIQLITRQEDTQGSRVLVLLHFNVH